LRRLKRFEKEKRSSQGQKHRNGNRKPHIKISQRPVNRRNPTKFGSFEEGGGPNPSLA